MSTSPDRSPLGGRRIAVTRPAEQAGRLCDAIEAAGGRAIRFPLLQITAPADPEALERVLARASEVDWAVFSSPTAVDRGLAALASRPRTSPPRWRVAAIGEGTARALSRHGIDDVLAPAERYDSEALLACPELATLTGRTVLVFRGQDGRETLEQGLLARGARVMFAACYARRRPPGDASCLAALARDRALDALVITSSEAARHLGAMLEGVAAVDVDALREVPAFAPHPRIAAALEAVGFARLVQTAGGDEGLLAGLIDWAGSAGGACA